MSRGEEKYIISCFLTSYTHQVQFFLLIFFTILAVHLLNFKTLKPDLVSVVTAHMVYFCACTRSDIFPKNARKLGVGRRQFDAGVNGLNNTCVIDSQNNVSSAAISNCKIKSVTAPPTCTCMCVLFGLVRQRKIV